VRQVGQLPKLYKDAVRKIYYQKKKKKKVLAIWG
jgi:hypothetical protein